MMTQIGGLHNVVPGAGLPGAPGGHHDGLGGHLLLHGREMLPECAHHRGPWGHGCLGLHIKVGQQSLLS